VAELWFARLCRSACVVRCGDGDRSGCLVAGEYAVSRTRGATGTKALEVGDSIQLIVSGESRIAASVVNVAGEICISRLARGSRNGFWLDAEETPTLAGLAAAIALDDGPDGPYLFWGWAELQPDGTSKLTIQRPSLKALSPAQLFRGLSVIVGGRYAGHAIELEEGPGGVWNGRLCAVPKHLLMPDAERPVEPRGTATGLLWAPPLPPTGEHQVTSIDPRVEQDHFAGQLPCPPKPPPPVGWANWKGVVPPAFADFAMRLLNDSAGFPMGSFVQTRVDGQLVAARVEWHELQGSTGKRGCFRGTTLFSPSEVASSPVLTKGFSGPAVRRWQQFLRRQGASTLAADGAFGDATAAATRDFQQARRLVADGIVGDHTYRAARELGFDEQDDGREDDGLTTWLLALSQAPTPETAAKAHLELRPKSGEVVSGAPQIRGSLLVFRTSPSIVERLLRRRRLGELTELAGLGIDWLAEEQREPDKMDPQRGRFGSLPERNGRRLTALVKRDGKRYSVALTLTSVDSAPCLEGSVTFHLHPTFKNVIRRVPVKNGRATLTLDVWGWFTVGAECEDGTRLELDIGDLPRPSPKR
jgi:hypothetical protein